ncbi:MAG: hypothetical protein IRY94_20990 [Rhodospirillaceae bacterium]|nr:hypothetical protein [Rhodospirillaceae bacterium]
MRLICLPTSGEPPRIVPAPHERAWMDATPDGFAYRCLPLNIANAHGWQILNDVPFVAEWDGGTGLEAVSVRPVDEGRPSAFSHFGAGVLTFEVRALFRTEPGYDLVVTGPVNEPKDGIHALTGVVETDWAPFTFTMNWKFTRRGTPVAFERDEPFCMFFPVRRGLVEEVEPRIVRMEDEPQIAAAYRRWAESRARFNQALKEEGSEARVQKWQKDYVRGSSVFAAAPPDHRTRLRVKPFKPAS